MWRLEKEALKWGKVILGRWGEEKNVTMLKTRELLLNNVIQDEVKEDKAIKEGEGTNTASK